MAQTNVFRQYHRHHRQLVVKIVVVALVWQLLLLSSDRETNHKHILAFVPSFPSHGITIQTRISKAFINPLDPRRSRQQSSSQIPLNIFLAASATKSGLASDGTATTDLFDTATQLLDLVLEQRTQDIEPSWKTWIRREEYEQARIERSSRIETLIEQLTRPTLEEGIRASKPRGFLQGLVKDNKNCPSVYYDPTECLFGSGFYCTLYFYYPNVAPNERPPEDPIWEQTSLLRSNIKGQQYYIRNDFSQAVINYSEVWGSSMSISAEGVLTPIDADDEGTTTKRSSSPSTSRLKAKSKSLRRLPDVFRVDATQISVSLPLGLSWKFDIQGSANLVVLYADPRIRIFVSPLPSKTLVGNWEQAGLVVVQVRSDLVPTNNQPIVDLR